MEEFAQARATVAQRAADLDNARVSLQRQQQLVAAGLVTHQRKNFSGLVPVPGDGRYEWVGFLPIKEKPHDANPAQGFIATANNNLIPAAYPHRDAVGWEWADPFRAARISEVLGGGRRVTMMDMMRLQTDYLSIPARSLVPLLAPLVAKSVAGERARRSMLTWDFVLDKNSVGE